LRIQPDYLNDYTSLYFILEYDFTGNKTLNSEITSRSIQTDKLCQLFFSLLVHSKYVICKDDRWTSLCDFSLQCVTTSFVKTIPASWHTLQSKSLGSVSYTKDTTSGYAIQWMRARVLYIYTWRSGHRHFRLANTMTMPPPTYHCKTYVLDCVFC
jgi:hypothetical protein